MATATAKTVDLSQKGEEEKPIYEFALKKIGEEFRHVWYVLGSEDLKSTGSYLPLGLKPLPMEVCPMATAVASGSTIYVLGGQWKAHCMDFEADRLLDGFTDVFYLDTLNLDHGWKAAPPLLNQRTKPSAVALDGKIYVIGGADLEVAVFGEIFDPKRNTWEPFPKPPLKYYHDFQVTLVNMAVASASGPNRLNQQQILLHFHTRKSLYAYCLKDQSWICADPDFGEWPAQFAVVDDVLFCLPWLTSCLEFPRTSVHAYHLATNKWLPLHGHLNFESWATLLHLGNGKLCLTWPEYPGFEDEWIVKCTKFTFKKIACGGRVFGIVVQEESSSWHFADGFCLDFITT